MKKVIRPIIAESYLALVFILAALAAAIFIYAPGTVKIPARDVEENKPEIVVEELEDGSKLVKNVKEGISVMAPEGWGVSHGVSYNLKLRISKAGSLQPDIPMELIDGSMFKVYDFDNSDKIELEEWMAKEEITDYEKGIYKNVTFVKTISKMYGEAEDSFDLVPIENSIVVSYFVSKENKVYEIACISIGDDRMLYSQECEDIFFNNFELY